MIAHVNPAGDGFGGKVSYLMTGKDRAQSREERVAWMEFYNLPTRDPEVAACMMRATADTSVSGTRRPLYHFSVSCAPDDPVTEAMLRGIADRTIRDLGLEEYEVLVVAHRDRSHPHLHFTVNRVHPERRTLWSTWRDCYRLERSLRAQERELGLAVVPGRLEPVYGRDMGAQCPEGRDPDARVWPRARPKRGDTRFVEDVRARAVPVLKAARSSWADVERGLAEQGLSLVVRGGGFRLTDGHREVKASEVGRAFSRFHIEKRFGPYPDYRARMAVAESVTRAEPRRVALPELVEPARPEPPTCAPADAAPPTPEPVRVPPAPAQRRRRHAVTADPPHPHPPAPVAPELPGWLRDLAQHGAAIEEAERNVREANRAVEEAERALATLSQRVGSAEAARTNATDRLREVYAHPKAALRAITAYRQQGGDRALMPAVSANPEQFGPLREERVPHLFGLVSRRDTRRARSTAPLLAHALDHYYVTAAVAPSPEERTTAPQRVADARRAAEDAQHARRALPPRHSSEYRRDLAELFRAVAAEVPGGADRLARLISTTIPTAARFVAGALEAVHNEERRRDRQLRPGAGIDF